MKDENAQTLGGARKAVSVIPQTPTIREYSAREHLKAEHRYLISLQQHPERWVSLLSPQQRALDPAEVLNRIRSRLHEIRELERKTKIDHPMNVLPPISALSVRPPILQPEQQTTPPISGNVEEATAQFCFLPSSGGPDANCPVIALRRIGGYWTSPGYWEGTWPEFPSHAVGFAAYARTNDPAFLPMHTGEMLWFVPCLQYVFPLPPSDCKLHWHFIFQTTVGFECDAVEGVAKFQPVIREQPNGGGVPSFEELSLLSDLFSIDQTLVNCMDGWSIPIYGSFDVKRGVQSSLWIGMSVQLFVREGSVGIPDCHQGRDATINSDLWNMGLIVPFASDVEGVLQGNGKFGVGFTMYFE